MTVIPFPNSPRAPTAEELEMLEECAFALAEAIARRSPDRRKLAEKMRAAGATCLAAGMSPHALNSLLDRGRDRYRRGGLALNVLPPVTYPAREIEREWSPTLGILGRLG